ncbi:MAG: hemolysin [Acidobacteria bacterium]|nr:hemolysin [Acidobacteriota bacterium]
MSARMPVRGRLVLPLLLAAAAAGGCGKGGGGAAPAQGGAAAAGGARAIVFPVEVATVAAQLVEYRVAAVGSVEAFETVQVTARVAGVVDKVDFAEGNTVATGQKLAEIEPDRYRVQVDSAKATLGAPTGGTIETRRVETGQYVQPGSVIATLLRREPLLLRFNVPESDAPSLREGMEAQFTVKDSPRTFRATITLVAGAAAESSRMVVVTARIDDPERALLRPGQFAEVTVAVGRADRPVVPETAIRPSERGFLAYVVEGDTARVRVLQLGMRTADGRVEVKDGLAPGESLVVRGAEALRDGAAVAVSTATPADGTGGVGQAAEKTP